MLTSLTRLNLELLASRATGSITFAVAVPMEGRRVATMAHHAASENPLPARGALGRRAANSGDSA
jgi:hypothetical protein